MTTPIPSDNPPNQYNFLIKENGDFTRVITYYQANGITPIPITGYRAQMFITASPTVPGPDMPTFLLTTENGGITLNNPTGGQFTINIPGAQMVASRWVTGTYDLFLRSPAGAVLPFLTGTVTIYTAAFNPEW